MREVMGKLCIVVMRERFILVGVIEPTEDAMFFYLRRASIVRRWGTTKGLGQLAQEGPQPNTKLDSEGDDIINKLEVSRVIPCNEQRWQR